MKPVYLICVEGDGNHNKVYNMLPHGDTFTAEWGRYGARLSTKDYAMWEWEKIYKSKIKKGYVDVTDKKQDLVEEVEKTATTTYKPLDNASVKALVEELQRVARQTIESNYTIKATAVTQAMIDEAQEKIDCLGKIATRNTSCLVLKDFNATLEALFVVLPRRMRDVKEYLAKSNDDFDKIVSRESNLLDVMRGQVYKPSQVVVPTSQGKDITILEENGLVIEEGSAEDIRLVKNLMNAEGSNSASYFRKVWKVTNLATQERFDNFVKSNKITNTKLLFHGSRTENFWSILRLGLILKPNAQICAKMFGSGIYFAPKCRKSMGYTSLSGSYWASGNSNIAYMAIFDCAYGNPLHTDNNREFYYNYGEREFKRNHPDCNCVHAHAGNQLRNDEIIFYNEAQITIKYLIQIEN